MKENTFGGVIAMAVGALLSYCVQLFIPLVVLLLVIVIDYLTGMAKAWIKGELSSKIGLRGIVKKVSYFVIVVVAGVMDWLIREGLSSIGVSYKLPFFLAAVVMVWLIINELISILENVEAIGGPKVLFLRKLLEKLKKTTEDQGNSASEQEKEPHEKEEPPEDEDQIGMDDLF